MTLALKIFVTAAGVILIGLINWYFLFSRRKR
jgi:plastocyanin domain-containing protein